MKTYRLAGKEIGHGGINCPCCNRYRSRGSNKTTKTAINRQFRRNYRIDSYEA